MDPTSFPHIFDRILDEIDDQDTLYALRATCRKLQTVVDKLFTYNPVVEGDGEGLVLYIKQTRLQRRLCPGLQKVDSVRSDPITRFQHCPS